MFLTKKSIPRRTFLRGMGVTVALPLMEAMVPAQTPLKNTAANPTTRFGFIYVPHGMIMDQWTPTNDGADFEITPILSPLKPFRDQLLIVSGLEAETAGPPPPPLPPGGDHSRSAAAFLSGARPRREGVYLGTTVDQVIAQKIGQDTPLPSLELGIEDVGYTGLCGDGYSCVYVNTISWATPTKPLPMQRNPLVLFERLFGDGSTPEQRLARRKEDRSILDSITDDVARVRTAIGPTDRTRLDEYLDEIREIERRIRVVSNATADLPLGDAPIGVPQSFDEHTKLMYDLQVLAFKAEITRVSTFMYARDQTPRTYPDSGVIAPFHSASHHGNKPEAIQTFAKINKYHLQLLAYFLEKLQSAADGDGTLLDHSLILLGSTMSNGNGHTHVELPVLVAGGASGRLKGGRHLRFPDHTPLSNLLLSVLHKVDIPLERFGDSTGTLEI